MAARAFAFSQPALRARWDKAFGPKVVLDGLTLDVKKGESLVVIGGGHMLAQLAP